MTLEPSLELGNILPLKVLVHEPKNLVGKPNKIAIISLHPGTGITGSTDLHKPYCCQMASSIGCVVFNLEYPLAGIDPSYSSQNKPSQKDMSDNASLQAIMKKWPTIEETTATIIAFVRYLK